MRSPNLLLILLVAVGGVTALSAAAFSKRGPGFQRKGEYSVIFISVDGLRPDAITAHGADDTPNFHRMRREGAFTDNARTVVDYTITLPNHTSMITSRMASGPEGHNWTINRDPPVGMTLHRNKQEHLSSMFSVAHDHGLTTALFASKTKFELFDLSYNGRFGGIDTTGEDNGRDKIDHYEMFRTSERVVDRLEKCMKANTFDMLMLHIRNPDTAGHVKKWKVEKPSVYMGSVKKADELLGDVFEKIDTEPGWRNRTYVVLTADHGGLTGAKQHKANEEPENFTIPFYVWGPGIPPGSDLYELNADSRTDPGGLNPPFGDGGNQPIRNAGAGNLCLDLLGLPAIPGSTVNSLQDLEVGLPAAPEPDGRPAAN